VALSAVEICNSALHKIGAARISSLSDSTKAAILCNDQYDRIRKEVLRSHPWNFAISYVALTPTVNQPIWDRYSHEFLLPADVLRVLATNLDEHDGPWEIGYNADGNKVLFCSATTIKLQYIKDLTNTTRFDPIFEEAVAFRLAADLAYSLVQSQTLQKQMYAYYEQTLARAMSFDAQESSAQSVQADEWTLVRG